MLKDRGHKGSWKGVAANNQASDSVLLNVDILLIDAQHIGRVDEHQAKLKQKVAESYPPSKPSIRHISPLGVRKVGKLLQK